MIKLPENIRIYLEKLFIYFSFAVVFVIPFGKELANITIIIWLSFWGLQLKFSDFKNNLKKDKHRILFVILFLLFIFINVFGILYSENKTIALKNIGSKIYILFFLLVFVSNHQKINKNRKTLMIFFIFGNIISSLICLFIAFYNSLNFENNSITFNASILEGYTFLNSITYPGNYFFYDKFSIFLHPSYFSISIILSIIFLFFIRKEGCIDKNLLTNLFSNKLLIGFLIIFHIIIVFLLSSKANFLALLTILFIIFISSRIKYKYIYIIALLIFSIIFVTRNSRFNFYLTNPAEETTKNSRLEIWESVLELSLENPIFGTGIGDSNSELLKKFEDNKHQNFKKSNYNAHNFFLEVLLSMGLTGLIVFLGIYFFAALIAVKQQNNILLLFLILTAINLFFESMLNRIAGVIFWSFFMLHLSFSTHNKLYSFNFKEFLSSKFNQNIGLLVFIIPLLYYFVNIQFYLNLNENNQLVTQSWFYVQNFEFLNFLKNPSVTKLIFGLLYKIFAIPNFLWIRFIHVFLLSLANLFLYKTLQNFNIQNSKIIALVIISFSFITVLDISFSTNFIILPLVCLFSSFYIFSFYQFHKISILKTGKKFSFIIFTISTILLSIITLVEILVLLNYDLNVNNTIISTGVLSSILSLIVIFFYNKLRKFKFKNLILITILLSAIIYSFTTKIGSYNKNLYHNYKSIPLLGIKDERTKVNNFDSILKIAGNCNLVNYKYYTDISILPFLLNTHIYNIDNQKDTTKIEEFDYLIISGKDNFNLNNYKSVVLFDDIEILRNKKTNIWYKNNNWKILETKNNELLDYEYITSEQGKYTVSAKIKYFDDDSTLFPRISIFALYDDSSANYTSDYNINKDNIERFYNISVKTDSSKKLIKIYGWLLDNSGLNGMQHVEVKDIKITIE